MYTIVLCGKKRACGSSEEEKKYIYTQFYPFLCLMGNSYAVYKQLDGSCLVTNVRGSRLKKKTGGKVTGKRRMGEMLNGD